MYSINMRGMAVGMLMALILQSFSMSVSAANLTNADSSAKMPASDHSMCEVLPSNTTGDNPPCRPICTLTATPNTIMPGERAVLATSCTSTVSAYAWTGSDFGNTVSAGIVSPTVTTTYSVAGKNATGSGNTSSVTVYVIAARPSQVDVRYYVPFAAAASGYVSQLRIANTGKATTPVSVALIDEVSGMVGAAHLLTPAMLAGQVVNFSAQQVEAALGVSLSAMARPRIRVIGAVSAITVQSLLLQPGGRISDVSTAYQGMSVAVSTYVPVAAAASGYMSSLRVINIDNGATPITVARIDPATGLIGPSGILESSLPAGAAITYSAAQIEAAIGRPVDANERPRILVSSAGAKLEVQSFLHQPEGAFTEVSTSQTGSTIDVRRYIFEAAGNVAETRRKGMTYLRIINAGDKASAITAAVIDGETGQKHWPRTIIETLPANAAITLSPDALEAAMGPSFPASFPARIRLSASAGIPLEVQSFLLQRDSTFSEMSNAIVGNSTVVSMHIPAVDAANGYATQLHVINPSASPTNVSVALIDSATGVSSSPRVLHHSLPGRAEHIFTSHQIEAALGVVLESGTLPRIQVFADLIEVQSFLTQPSGAVSEVSGGPLGGIWFADRKLR